jgi:uncharacterized protein YjbI with pentapeptide repeats
MSLPVERRVALKVLVGIGIVLAFLAVVIWVPKLSFIQPGGELTAAERAKAESDLRGHLLQALGGLVLILGAYFTGRTFTLNREGQITERFTRAVEQLADDKLDIRLGGIYALERIAHDSETHYEPVIEVLTAFLREHARWRPEAIAFSDPASRTGPPDGLRVDFQAAATVLQRRDRGYERPNYSLDLRRVDLDKASLPSATLSKANLSGANLSGAFLSGADLSGADLSGADLSNVYLIEGNLSGANLSGGATLSQATLIEVNLSGASFSGANLIGADLRRADLSWAYLGNADLSRAYLVGANLRGATLSGADLIGAELIDANLSGANLTGADLTGAALGGADLTTARLAGANLTAVVGLTQTQLDVAETDEHTTLPDRLDPEEGS